MEIRERQEGFLLANPIQALRVQRQAFTQAVVKHTESAADHVLRRLGLCASQPPRESDAWTEIRPACPMRLRFSPQSAAQPEVGPQLPVLFMQETNLVLPHVLPRST